MAKIIKFLIPVVLLFSLFAQEAMAGLFDQKEADVPKWSRFYARFGRATGEYGDKAESFSVNYIGYKQMRGMFGYGAELGYLYNNGKKIQTLSGTMSLRPDWNLQAEPSLDLSFGTADLSGPTPEKNGNGTVASIGVSLDLVKGKMFSTTVGFSSTFLNSNSQVVKSTSFQLVTISFNLDLF